MAGVDQVGYPDEYGNLTDGSVTEVGLLDVHHESCIVITPDGDVELFHSDDISEQKVREAAAMRDGLMYHLNS